MLNKICKEAWETIATSFQNTVADDDDDAVAGNAAGVAKSKFSENLLRNILDSALHYFQSGQPCWIWSAASTRCRGLRSNGTENLGKG